MIRCNPSQIHLTSTDVGELDRRIANRRRASTDVARGKARLSVAPRLPHIVTDNCVPTHRGSTATLDSSASPVKDAQDPQTYLFLGTDHSSLLLQEHIQRSDHLTTSSHEEPTKTDPLRSIPSSAPRLSLPRLGTPDKTHLRHRRRQTSPSHHQIANLDGAHEIDRPDRQHPNSVYRGRAPVHAGREVFRELPGGDLPAGSPQASSHTSRHPRTRRLTSSSHEHRAQPHLPSPFGSRRATDETQRDTTPFVVVLDDRNGETSHTFDPGAPPFTPRVRFGSTTVLPGAGQSDSDRPSQEQSTALRIQSPSEQNSNISRASRSQARPDRPQTQNRTSTLPPGSQPRRPRSNAVTSRSRRSSENSTLPLPSPNLDRYPLLLPTASTSHTGRNAFDRGSRVPSREHGSRHPSPQQTQRHDSGASAAPRTLSPVTDANLLYPSSPIVSSSSQSSPDLSVPKAPPFVHSRSSSLLWRENSPQPSESSRVPSIVSAASGISSIYVPDRPPSAPNYSPNVPDAAAEFLKSRPSPLDGLTAELSRLSTALSSQATNFGGDHDTPTSTRRVRLLSGSIFDVGYPIHEKQNDPELDPSLNVPSMSRTNDRETSSMRLLVSPSRMTMNALSASPETSNTHPPTPPIRQDSSPTHLTPQPHTATFDTTTPAHKVAAIATPKVTVYNDATPSHLQPQTPADLHRSNRRARNRSDSSVHREAFCVGPILVAHRPMIPERRAYRNTYPTNIPGRGTQSLPSNDIATIASSTALIPGPTSSHGDQATDSQTSAFEEAENEFAAQLADLERERMVWQRRRQGGSLDVTPPKEGRFERFLN